MALAQVSQKEQKIKPSKLENAVRIFEIGTNLAGLATNAGNLLKKKPDGTVPLMPGKK